MITFLIILLPVISGFALLYTEDIKLKKVKKTVLFTLLFTLALTLLNNFIIVDEKVTILTLLPNVDIGFKIDNIAIIFSTLMIIIWVLTAVYSFDYMSHYREQKRYFAFFLVTIGLLFGVAYAKNLVTLYMFFELMTLSAWILVIHERSNESMLAGRKFVYYSIFGASLGLIAVIYLQAILNSTDFIAGGYAMLNGNDKALWLVLFAIIGFGSKAGLYPLHSWLTKAHPIAPAPASAILSALITKAGIIAIIRVCYYIFPPTVINGSFVQDVVIYLALLTILMGSMLALREKNLKKRLAYSSISQLSYVILGLMMFNSIAFTGAILQVIFHALAKSLLFLGAGSLIYSTHHTNVEKYRGMGFALKETFILILVGGLSLVGIPLTAGFVSKWYLALGSLQNELGILAVLVIMISALLTAGYLLYFVVKAYFVPQNELSKEVYPLEKNMKFSMSIIAVLIIVLGIYPTILIDFISALTSTIGL